MGAAGARRRAVRRMASLRAGRGGGSRECATVGARRIARRRADVAVGDRGAAGAWARARARPWPMKPSSPAWTTRCSSVDGDLHEAQQRDAGGLHIGAQHFVGVAAGEKYIGADDLGGVVGADAQQIGRIEPEGEDRDGQQQDEGGGEGGHYFADCHGVARRGARSGVRVDRPRYLNLAWCRMAGRAGATCPKIGDEQNSTPEFDGCGGWCAVGFGCVGGAPPRRNRMRPAVRSSNWSMTSCSARWRCRRRPRRALATTCITASRSMTCWMISARRGSRPRRLAA